jgi:hypothetical protein
VRTATHSHVRKYQRVGCVKLLCKEQGGRSRRHTKNFAERLEDSRLINLIKHSNSLNKDSNSLNTTSQEQSYKKTPVKAYFRHIRLRSFSHPQARFLPVPPPPSLSPPPPRQLQFEKDHKKAQPTPLNARPYCLCLSSPPGARLVLRLVRYFST